MASRVTMQRPSLSAWPILPQKLPKKAAAQDSPGSTGPKRQQSTGLYPQRSCHTIWHAPRVLFTGSAFAIVVPNYQRSKTLLYVLRAPLASRRHCIATGSLSTTVHFVKGVLPSVLGPSHNILTWQPGTLTSAGLMITATCASH